MKLAPLLFLLALSAHAETVIQLHTVSKHVSPGYNENNYGLGVRHYYEKYRHWTVGGFRNSENNNSLYAGVGYEWPLSDGFKVGLIGGIVTGYEKYSVAPLLVPVLHYKRANLTFAPYPESVVLLSFDIGIF